MLGVRLDDDMERLLDRVAMRKGVSKSDITRDALRKYLRREAISRDEAKAVVARLNAQPHDDEFWQGDVENWQ